MQVGIVDFKGVFQDHFRAMVREGILDLIAQEVTALCGEIHRPDSGIYRRAGSEKVTIRTSWGKELISKRRVRALQEDGTERDVKLNTYEEIRHSKGIFDGILKYVKKYNCAAFEALEARLASKVLQPYPHGSWPGWQGDLRRADHGPQPANRAPGTSRKKTRAAGNNSLANSPRPAYLRPRQPALRRSNIITEN